MQLGGQGTAHTHTEAKMATVRYACSASACCIVYTATSSQHSPSAARPTAGRQQPCCNWKLPHNHTTLRINRVDMCNPIRHSISRTQRIIPHLDWLHCALLRRQSISRTQRIIPHLNSMHGALLCASRSCIAAGPCPSSQQAYQFWACLMLWSSNQQGWCGHRFYGPPVLHA